MYPIQKFAIENIYCAPAQDFQFNFRLVRVTKKKFPVRSQVRVYDNVKNLPDSTSLFHVYTIGNIHPELLLLLSQHKDWFRDTWISFSEDMVNRNYIVQVYDDIGINYPRSKIYYSFIDESSILIALKIDTSIRINFNVEEFKYMRLYSNNYYASHIFDECDIKNGIQYISTTVLNNVDKVSLQNWITNLKNQSQGDVIVYVNGLHTDNVNLNIPNNSFLEVLYDQSIISKERYPISSLNTFQSIKDSKQKYLLFRDKIVDSIQYDDDLEIYISTSSELVNKGVYFYQHKDYVTRNVTDKDYSLYTVYLNNQAVALSNITSGSIPDKEIVVYTRMSSVSKPLVHSALKLHELYKLPQDTEKNVIGDMGTTITDYKADHLENSNYFKVLGLSKLVNLTNTLATDAIGYSATKFYFGNTPVIPSDVNAVDVPLLYRSPSTVYEYDLQGKLINITDTIGPVYSSSTPNVKHIEFIRGRTPNVYDPLYESGSTIELKSGEYIILESSFSGVTRLDTWTDVTNDTNKVTISNNTALVTGEVSSKFKIVYLDEPLMYDISIPTVDGTLYFPIQVTEDRGTGVQSHRLDFFYKTIEVFLNGCRLAYNIDYFMDYPYISICNKMYIDHQSSLQHIHIRATGIAYSKEEVNSDESVGFVHHGVLSRNGKFDIRDDRVISIYVNGKIYDRANVLYAEDDNTIRLTHYLNGLPYSVSERLVSIQEVTGLPTLPYYVSDRELNKRVSDLYNLILPEPQIEPLAIITQHYTLYSPLISKVIHDMLDGNIPQSLYMTPYNDTTILNLIENNYKQLAALDPIKKELPYSTIEIHPHPFNTTVEINLYQYRFMINLIRILTANQPELVNDTDLITITTNVTDEIQIGESGSGVITV